MFNKFIFIFTLSMSVMAGDMYLVCESPDGEMFYDAYIENGKAEVRFEDQSIYNDSVYEYIISLDLDLAMGGNYYIIGSIFYDGDKPSFKDYMVVTDEYSTIVPVSKNIACRIAD